MSKLLKNVNVTANIKNGTIKVSTVDKEPKKHNDSYDEDYEEFDNDSNKGVRDGPGTKKSPLFTRTSQSKANLKNNSSMASLNNNTKASKGSVNREGATSSKEGVKLFGKSKSKDRTALPTDNLRGSVAQKTTTKFPGMALKKLAQSYSDAKYKTQFGSTGALGLRGIKRPPMLVVEETIETAKSKLDKIAKKREKAQQAVDEDDKLYLLNEESNMLKKELKTLNNALNLFIDEMRVQKLKTGNKKQVDPAEHEERKRLVKDMEMENYDKMTKNLMVEHNKLTKRLDLVSNPQYVFDLKEKVEEMKNYVRDLKNNKKQLEKQEKNRDKKLNYMLNKGGEIGKYHTSLTMIRPHA